ncbi:ATP-dependent DNA helicase RecG [Alicyclobacillus hesperidum subsp. aegles]|uniref:ATP-dependent DNA helicase RecG n=1 Tax=Alicyclobacillus hesperidum TaxID=89784 RepID=UPI00222B7DC2|nr:ATP-dependent DNA helicase RecG [Alicyclobacillus hesperidum]GLG01063.1 ATP-dependent DNA helicase RecG [Alicyclobacillus hesperidum subsp. aegles]
MNLKQQSVRGLPGVGPAKEHALAALGIHSIHDLLHYFPFRYEDRQIRPLAEWQDGARVTVRAVVSGNAIVRWRGAKSMLTARLRVDGQHLVLCTWFSQHYLKSRLTDGRLLIVTGRWDAKTQRIVAAETSFDVAEPRGGANGLLPVYRANKEIGSRQIHQLIGKAIDLHADELPDVLPYALAKKYRLWNHRDAVVAMHRPRSAEDLRQARRCLAFEEFLLFQIQLHWFRMHRKESAGVARRVPDDAVDRFARFLPAPLTDAQRRACMDILHDLQADRAMARLVQGDVGSGKTWVALFACYAAYLAGFQAALMAPTEILAEQHAREAERVLTSAGISIRLLTGSVGSKARREILEGLACGAIHLVVGTHALLTEDVTFCNLGLIATDEQHRFGVSQRSALRSKGASPDVLMLSATPIPRTLALAVYGDMDVSLLDELPKGRQPIETIALSKHQEAQAIRFIRRELAAGRQAYIVTPAIEQSETVDFTALLDVFDKLSEELVGFRLGLLHGKMAADEKDRIMRAFRDGEIDALVATTVIEVGIDVKNATVMAIYNAERFGLAQLHQLRGRVGRGSHKSYCILLSEANNETAHARIQTMLDTQDGFRIAERDLELRGPGEFLGVRQSGLPQFAVGDIVQDQRMMSVARDEAARLLASDSFWYSPATEALREAVQVPVEETVYRD